MPRNGNIHSAGDWRWVAQRVIVRHRDPDRRKFFRVAPQPDEEEEGDLKVQFAYDYMGRRVQKQVSPWVNVGHKWDLTLHRKFVWSGWLMLLELEGNAGVSPVDTIARWYTWGVDSTGQNGDQSRDREGAGTLEAAGLAPLTPRCQGRTRRTVAAGVSPAVGSVGVSAAMGSVGISQANCSIVETRQPLTRQRPRRGHGRRATAELRSGRRVKGNWNVVALTGYDSSGDNDGNVVERYSYTPYGEFIVLNTATSELGNVLPTSTVGNPFAHQGLPFDQEKGSYQNRHREYTAQLQRFVQRDPLVYAEGTNLYGYVSASPVVGIDPHGDLPPETHDTGTMRTKWRDDRQSKQPWGCLGVSVCTTSWLRGTVCASWTACIGCRAGDPCVQRLLGWGGWPGSMAVAQSWRSVLVIGSQMSAALRAWERSYGGHLPRHNPRRGKSQAR